MLGVGARVGGWGTPTLDVLRQFTGSRTTNLRLSKFTSSPLQLFYTLKVRRLQPRCPVTRKQGADCQVALTIHTDSAICQTKRRAVRRRYSLSDSELRD